MKNMLLVLIITLFSSNIFGQANISGEWVVGEQNTVVKIEKKNGAYTGKIISSDNPKAKIGQLMVKEVQQKKNKWEGKIYSPKRKEWYDAEFSKKGNNLDVEIERRLPNGRVL